MIPQATIADVLGLLITLTQAQLKVLPGPPHQPGVNKASVLRSNVHCWKSSTMMTAWLVVALTKGCCQHCRVNQCCRVNLCCQRCRVNQCCQHCRVNLRGRC